MNKRWHRLKLRITMAAASLPLFQFVAPCDPNSLEGQFFSQLASSMFSTFVVSVQQVILQNFPSADILQILFGANRQPFFQM